MLVTVLMREDGTPCSGTPGSGMRRDSTLSSSCRRHNVKRLGRIWIKRLCWSGGKYAEHSRRCLVFGAVVGEPTLGQDPRLCSTVTGLAVEKWAEAAEEEGSVQGMAAPCGSFGDRESGTALEYDRMLYFWVADGFS